MLCSRAFRSSVPNNVRLRSMARRTAPDFVLLTMLGTAELVRKGWGERSQRARVVRASELDAMIVMLAHAALAALGPARC